MAKPHLEKKQPTIKYRLTNNAVAKAISLAPKLAKLGRTDTIAWLNHALLWGELLPTDVLVPECVGRVVMLPAEHLTDLGDRIVALVLPGDEDGQVVTTITSKRSVCKPSPADVAAMEVVRAAHAAQLPTIAAPRAAVVPPHVVVDRYTSKEPAAPANDNRGAQLARMAMAGRRITGAAAIESTGLHGDRLLDLLENNAEPSLKEAVAIHRVLGVPLDAWTKPAEA